MAFATGAPLASRTVAVALSGEESVSALLGCPVAEFVVVMVTVGDAVGLVPPVFESPGASSPPQAANRTAAATMAALRNPAMFNFMSSFSNRHLTAAVTDAQTRRPCYRAVTARSVPSIR